MMRRTSRLAAVVIGLAPLPWVPARADDVSRVDEIVLAEMQRQQVPGVAVAVVRNGETVLAKGYGLANVEHQVPVTPDTIFQSGSLGKGFTAALVMTLVEEGTVGLDDPLTKYFPDAPASWRPIVVRHLLTHTSGLPDYTGGLIDLRRDYTEDGLLELAYGLAPEFPAGSRWNYSNTGYVLLGIVVRKATGRFYGDLLRERIFAPLGMSTARVITEEEIVPHRAAGYRLDAGVLKNQQWVAPQLNTTADGSLYFSLKDLLQWERAVRTGASLRRGSWTQMFEPVRLSSGRTYPYGFGWDVADVNGRRTHQHGGSWQGFKAHLARYVDDDLTVIVLSNLAQARPERFVEGIAAMFNPQLRPVEPTPIEDREPAVAARLKALLAAARAGTLAREEFAYLRAGFFPEGAERYRQLLAKAGELGAVALLERKELGDDRVYLYSVAFGDETYRVRLGLAPDDRISLFSIERR